MTSLLLFHTMAILLSPPCLCSFWWKCSATFSRTSAPCSSCAEIASFWRPVQYVNVEPIRHMISVGDLIRFPSKHTLLPVFQTVQQIAARPTKWTCLPGRLQLIQIQNWERDIGLTFTPKIYAKMLQTYLITGHSKNRCLTDSSSWQRHKQDSPSISF